MKKLTCLLVIPLLFLVTTVLACQPGGDGGGLVISPAPIHEVDVAIAESFPPQVMVHIQGGLSDGCTEFHDLKTARSGNVINIAVTVQRPRNAICTQVYGYFEQNVNLGSDFVSGQTYTVKVNDKTTSFVME